MSRPDEVILVDEYDVETGTMEKMEAHRSGLLHRAFSVFIFNTKGELLLQKRSASKYHSGGLWTNTCCSHPRPGENIIDSATRRLKMEMGITASLSPLFTFIYRAHLDRQLTEHEFDHVLYGVSDQVPSINHEEADAYRYAGYPVIMDELSKTPAAFTEWFKLSFSKVAQAVLG